MKNPITDELRRLVREHCKESSAYQICKATGINNGTMSKFRSRQTNLSGATLDKLAEYFNVTLTSRWNNDHDLV